MVDLVYCLTNFIFLDVPLSYYQINTKIINNILSFFWRYISFYINCNRYEFFFFFFWFFDISLLYYFKLSSFIIYCLSSKDTYFTLGISLLFSFVIIFELFCCEFFETFVILSAVLLPIKPPVSWLYWISRYFL